MTTNILGPLNKSQVWSAAGMVDVAVPEGQQTVAFVPQDLPGGCDGPVALELMIRELVNQQVFNSKNAWNEWRFFTSDESPDVWIDEDASAVLQGLSRMCREEPASLSGLESQIRFLWKV